MKIAITIIHGTYLRYSLLIIAISSNVSMNALKFNWNIRSEQSLITASWSSSRCCASRVCSNKSIKLVLSSKIHDFEIVRQLMPKNVSACKSGITPKITFTAPVLPKKQAQCKHVRPNASFVFATL